MTSIILDLKGLTKRFGTFTAVNNLSIKIQEKEIFGFLGPNGAGKTTTISMLTTLVKPTSGTAVIDGYNLIEHAGKVRNIIGVVPQSFSLFPELTATENLEYIGKLYSMDSATIKERTAKLLHKVSLFEQRDRISGIFSGGMKQRLSLAASIISHPKILFMDEPTTGLDPQSRIAIRDLTRELNKEGITIVYTTHDMEEAEKLCDRIVIMDKGKVIADGTEEQIKKLITHGHTIKVIVERPSKGILEEIRKQPLVKKATQEGNTFSLVVEDPKTAFYPLVDLFKKHKEKIVDIHKYEPSLEQVFVTLTKKDLRD